jgi:hypothetical protein
MLFNQYFHDILPQLHKVCDFGKFVVSVAAAWITFAFCYCNPVLIIHPYIHSTFAVVAGANAFRNLHS